LPTMVKSVSIVILNFNGAEILPVCLPSIIVAAQKAPVPCNVIVLDNKSADSSVELVRRDFPQVKIEIAEKNNFLFSYNDLIPRIESDIIILLNNDVRVDENFVGPLLEHFNERNVFAVVPMEMPFGAGDPTDPYGFGSVSFGAFKIKGARIAGTKKAKFSLYGSNCAFDREKFLKLQGFDDLFYPFSWEDADLCYRAWKRGWATVFEPASKIYHKEDFSLDRGEVRGRRIITRRNSILFVWKNITDPLMILNHVILQLPRLLYSLICDRAYIPAFFQALTILPKALDRRRREILKGKISDAKISEILSSGEVALEKLKVRPRVGIISLWYERGVSYQSRFLAKILSGENDVMVLAHDRLSGDDEKGIYKKLTFSRNDSPARVINWIKKERPAMIFSPGRSERDEVLDWCNRNDVPDVTVVNYEEIKEKTLENLKKHARVICPVKCTFDLLSKYGLNNIQLIRWAVDTSVYSPRLAEIKKPFRFIHNAGWGGTAFRKNTEAVVKAFDIASKKNKDIDLVLKTQLPLREYPKAVMATALGNPRIIVNEKNLSLSDVVELYRSCHVSLLPSMWEGIGLPFLESLSIGLPVITVDAPPMNEWIKNDYNGHCCKVLEWRPRKGGPVVEAVVVDVEDFAKQILRFSDPEVIKGMRGNCIEAARGYEENFVKEINKFTRSLIEG